jgi:hypothetical protein
VSDFDSVAALPMYGLPHAYLSAKFALDNGYRDSVQLKRRFQVWLPNLVSLIETENVATDVGIECIAMMFISGNRQYVKESWIAQILSVQMPDGGWRKIAIEGNNSKPHTTILALWVLLEYANPSAHNIPIHSR